MGCEKKNLVILGRTGSGKSELIKGIGEKGFNTLDEMGRTILNFRRSFVHSKEEIKKRQILMYESQLYFEQKSEGITFFERALPCSLVFTKYFLRYVPKEMDESIMMDRYHRIFVLDPLAFKKDDIRVETDEKMAQEIQDLTEKTYKDFEYNLISVPKFSDDKKESLENRVKFILDNLD